MAYINENNEYYNGRSIVYDGRLIINPTDEQLSAAVYHEVVPPEPTAAQLLDAAKQTMLARIEEYDATREQFEINGQTMWLGHELRQQLKTSVEAYIAIGQNTVTKWFGGQEYTFPCNTWLQMLAVLEVYAAEVLNVTEAHKAAVDALTDIEDVEGYDYTDGYPQTLEFTPQTLAEIAGGHNEN